MDDQRPTRSKWRSWAWPWELRRQGVLGINARNGNLILPLNPRSHFPRVDDKLVTKIICEQYGIPVPTTYGVIRKQSEVRNWLANLNLNQDFVIKPAQGSGGRGIIVVAERRGDNFITTNGKQLSSAEIQYHLSAILAGLYSLGGRTDAVLLEQRIIPHRALQQITVGGTPDIRLIVYRGVPAMAMLRLPTRVSAGRANLHQGAAAVGIDLLHGITVGGVCGAQRVDLHPDTNYPIAGNTVPYWNTVITAAKNLANGLEMGYLGIDFVLDEHRGPLVLEANARPGLTIQLANRAPLIDRLLKIDDQLARQELPTKNSIDTIDKRCQERNALLLSGRRKCVRNFF